VIGTASGGIPEFVTDGETGLLFASGHADALAAALNRLFGTTGLRDRLAVTARKGVLTCHTITARAEAVADLYRSLVPAGAGAAR
jgi:glycosyltransferase involved in cell wall biosynthesis